MLHSMYNFYVIFLTVHLYLRYTPIMLPKKSSRDDGIQRRKTTREPLGVKEEIIAEHENGVRASDLAVEVWHARIDNINVFDE